MTDLPADSLAALVERARAAIAGSVVPPTDGAAAAFRATSAEGMVTAEVTPDGRVSSIVMDPLMMRRPSEDICASIAEAVNAALDQRPGRPDSTAILAELRAVQDQSVHEMAKISQAFTDALATARRA